MPGRPSLLWKRTPRRSPGRKNFASESHYIAGRSRRATSAGRLNRSPTPSSGKAMAEADLELTARIARGFADVDTGDWQRLAGTDDPFLDRRFLALLESSGSV